MGETLLEPAVPVAAVGVVPLFEGPAGRNPEPGPMRKAILPPASSRYSEPAPYARGSHKVALAFSSDNSSREVCKQALVSNFYAGTSVNPIESRRKLWAKMASAAVFTEPFSLTPDLIYQVVGVLRAAEFRSAEQYLDVAFAEHVNRGSP